MRTALSAGPVYSYRHIIPPRIFLVSPRCTRRLSCRAPMSLVSILIRDYTDYTSNHLRSTSVSPSSSPSPLWFMTRAFNCGPRDGVHANVARRDGMGITKAAHIALHVAVAGCPPELSSSSAKPPHDPDAPRNFYSDDIAPHTWIQAVGSPFIAPRKRTDERYETVAPVRWDSARNSVLLTACTPF